MEKRKAKLISTKGGSGSSTFRATLPTSWIRSLGLDEETRDIELELVDNKIIISKERLGMLKLIVRDHGEEEILKEGTFEEILEYLKDNEEVINWVLDEDPDIELPNLDEVENIDDLEFELKKIDLSWWSLDII